MLGTVLISIVYTIRDRRKRIISAFEADGDDILDYVVTYACEWRSHIDCRDSGRRRERKSMPRLPRRNVSSA